MGLRVVYILVFITLSLSNAQAQNTSQEFHRKWNDYQRTLPGTGLHLFFNQEKFYPGDTIFFSAYFFFEDLSIVKGSQLIEVNLCNSSGKSMLQAIVQLKDGIGYNQLIVPEELPAGFYLVTAHSNWMRNFGSESIFKKLISIVKENEITADDKCVLKAASEGGQLISGIANRLVITSNRKSTPVILMDQNDHVISQNQTNNHGVATFEFIPQINSRYTVHLPQESCTASISNIVSHGVVMQLENLPAKRLTLHLSTGAGSPHLKELVTLVVTAQAHVQYLEFVRLSDSTETRIELPSEKFPTGIIHAEILDFSGNTLAFRDFYHINKKSAPQVSVITDKPRYQTREKVSMEITVTDGDGKPLEGEFSLRVLNSALFKQEEKSMAGHQSPSRYSPAASAQLITDSVWFQKLDVELIVNAQPLPWRQILAGNKPAAVHPFRTVVERKGRVVYAGTSNPVPDLTQIMFYLQKSKLFHQTFTENSGLVGLTLQGITGSDEFFYLAAHNGKYIPVDVHWEKDSINLPVAPRSLESLTPDGYAMFMERKRFIDQAFNAYSSTEIENTKTIGQPDDFETEIAKADVSINVRDYITFATMQELIREIVPALYSRKSKKRSIVRVTVAPPLVSTDDPLYIIDGIATRNTDFFLSLNPAELKEIKVINSATKLIPLGLLGKNGIVIVNTLKGGQREPLNTSDKLIAGVTVPVSFQTRALSGMNADRPAFHSTLYWNPLIKTDATGKVVVTFYCTDDIGMMTAEVTGRIVKHGMVCQTTTFEVVLKPANE